MAGWTSEAAPAVIVISFNGPPLVRRCLSALREQTDASTEVVVVVGDWQERSGELTTLEAEFPRCRWIRAPASHNVARMRRLGIEQTRGDPLVFLEDDCVPNPSWVATLGAASHEAWAALGGGIAPGPYRRALDWAVYFSEYGRFMPPIAAGATTALPGTNVAYRRQRIAEVLPATGQGTDDGFYETFVNHALREEGHPLRVEPRLVVHHFRTWGASRALRVRYHHGRGYAGLRTGHRPWWRRLPFVAMAVLLPAVLVWRHIVTIAAKRRAVHQALRAAPWSVLLACAWSAGEFVGYLVGPGAALDRWR